MEARLFFRPDKPKPEEYGDLSPYDLTNILPLGTQVLYPTGRVYELVETSLYEITVSGLPERKWAGFAKGEGDKISPHVKMHALLEGIDLHASSNPAQGKSPCQEIPLLPSP